jgi:hypothetical protein
MIVTKNRELLLDEFQFVGISSCNRSRKKVASAGFDLR